MSVSGGDPHDPFRTDAPSTPATEKTNDQSGGPSGGPQAPPPEPPPDPVEPLPQSRALALRLAIISVAAVAAAFFAWPVGAALGVVTVVLALRSKGTVPPRVRAIALVAGSIAIVVGVAISVVAWVFRTEFLDYNQCVQGANTRQAQQNCQDALTDALTSRLGL
ncbi:MAG: hypothetical protein WCA29_06785 [Jiangellales bacterium]